MTVASTFSKHPSRFPEHYPPFAHLGSGPYLTYNSVNYIDWANGLGSVGVLGHANRGVVAAVQNAVISGSAFHISTEDEQATALVIMEALNKNFREDWAGGVRFGLHGTDVTTAAVRLSKAITGRNMIVTFTGSYHGDSSSDLFISTKQPGRGVDPYLQRPLECPWNDLSALEALFDVYRDSIAAVIFAVPLEAPTEIFSKGLQELCDRNQALLIADEVVTGFRFALGGACEKYRIVPDLACYGKALGSGIPVSALVGRKEFMDEFDLDKTKSPVWMSFTNSGNRIGLAAAFQTVHTLMIQEKQIYEDVTRAGQEIMVWFASECKKAEFDAEVKGTGARSAFFFGPRGKLSGEAVRAMFWDELAKIGVLMYAANFPTCKHDRHICAVTCQAMGVAIEKMLIRIDGGEAFVPPAPLFAPPSGVRVS